jgi:uncharacterized protein
MAISDFPRRVDPYKLADQHATLSGGVEFGSMPRVIEMLGDKVNQVAVKMTFSRDEKYRCVIEGQLETRAEVTCERCLNPMDQTIQSDFTLCVVPSDEAARDIPREYDPLIVTEQFVDVVDIVEDEILLALPMFSYHADADCDQGPKSFGDDINEPTGKDASKEKDASEEKVNPFNILSTLKLKK